MLWKRLVRFFAHVRGQSLGRLKKPIIRLHVVQLRQLKVGLKVGVRGSECSVFLPSGVSSFPLQRSWEVTQFQSLSVYLPIPRNSIATWAVSPSKWAGAGQRVKVQWGTCSLLTWLRETNCTATACARAYESWCIISTLSFSCILTSLSCTAPLYSQAGFPCLPTLLGRYCVSRQTIVHIKLHWMTSLTIVLAE